jgi:hypothetical protein
MKDKYFKQVQYQKIEDEAADQWHVTTVLGMLNTGLFLSWVNAR